MRKISWLVLGVSLLFPMHEARAQDSHFWNLHYGTRGELVSGVVVGSALDLSSTFYNPGAVVRIENPSVLLTGTVFSIQSISVANQAPNEKSPSSLEAGPAPSMVAGLLPAKWFHGRVGYSFLTRQQLNFRLTVRDGAVIGFDQPGDSLSVGGEGIYEQNMSEDWAGLTWSRAYGDRFSVGTTVYGVYHSQRMRRQLLVEAFGANGYGASVIHVDEVDYWTASALAKIGVLLDLGRTSVGASLTTPNVPVAGSGTVVANNAFTGDINFDGLPDSGAEVAYAEGRHATFRSPLSVALGASHAWETTTVLATVEYFHSIDEYEVTAASGTPVGPGITTVPVRYEHALKSIWNAGVAVEHRFAERTTGYAAFITDRSAYRPVRDRNVAITDWNILHVSGGLAFVLGGTELTLGAAYLWGNAPAAVQTAETGSLPPPIIPGDVTYRRINAILGFSF